MITAKDKLESVKMYGRLVSQFLLPDQMKFIETAMEEYAKEQLILHTVIEIDTQLIEMINKCDQTAEGLRNNGFEVTAISSEAMAQAYLNVRDMINCSR